MNKLSKRIINLELLKIYNKSIQKWLNCYYDTFNHTLEYILMKTYSKCSFCKDKNKRELNKPIFDKTVKCYCPIHLCSWCYTEKEIGIGLSLFSKLDDFKTFKEIKAIIKQMIFELNQYKYIKCFIWSE